MNASRTPQSSSIKFIIVKILSVQVGLLPLYLSLFIMVSCVSQGYMKSGQITGIVQDEDGVPIPNATVRIQTTQITSNSDQNGRFTLSIPEPPGQVTLTAWAPNHYIGNQLVLMPSNAGIEISLRAHATIDNPSYKWLSSVRYIDEENPGCAACHSTQGTELAYSLPADEWLQDAHASSARNPRFLTMYLGTDTQGNRSPLTQFISKKDYGIEPLKPDLELPYYGPGYKLDFPETAGNCATCHTPLAAIDQPHNTDPTILDEFTTEGISCDFCHKIWDVVLDPINGTPSQNMPGVMSYHFRRPPEGHQFFAGPFDDVAPGDDTYSALQTQSQFCAPCHHGIFWDVVVYDSFGEWLRSPYSDSNNGQTCQECHMPRLGNEFFALPEKGGLRRDPETIFSHKMLGGSNESFLQNAVSMTVTTAIERGNLQIKITLTNDQTGHYVPSGSPLRHLILLVSVEDQSGQLLTMKDGPRLPAWCGEGDPSEDYYAGLPGKVYAKVLAEQWTNISPTGSYWNPTYLVSDNRLPPFGSDVSVYSFSPVPQEPVKVHIRLIYRRAFIELIEQKGWQTPDILMKETILILDP